jgi:hypothetical protein
MATTFARLNKDELQFTKSGSVFATMATDASADTLKFTAAGGTGELYISGVKTPTANTHAANKSYVDSVAQGLDVKASVRCATTAAIDLATELADGSTVDGVTLATGDRVLVKHQTSVDENGIYVVKGSGTPDRAADLGAGSRAAGAFVFIESGTIQQDTGYVCTSDSNVDTVGTDTLEWTTFSGAGALTAGVGLTKTGTTIDVNGAFGTTDLSTSGDVSVNTDKFTIVGATGNTAVGGTLGVQGDTALAGDCGVTGDLTVNTDKFTIAKATGNTAVAGTLGVQGDTALAGACGVTGDLNVNTNKLTVDAANGNTAIAGSCNIAGGVLINTDKFTVTAGGDTSVAGTFEAVGAATMKSTCSVADDLSVNVNKFTVAAASGDTDVGGTLEVSGNTAVGNAFSVDAATGDCSANAYISTSDRTLKQDIESIPAFEALNVVMGMRAVEFAFIRKPDDPRVGVIAQEMREVAPALVKTIDPPESSGRDTHLAVNYGDLTAYLIGSVQALQAQVTALQAQQQPA